jgi:hypothetical protein
MTQISITGRNYYIDPINPNAGLSTNPGRYIYSPTAQRLMYTITKPNIHFEFQAPPTQFEMEGFGAEINEIKRPYSLPIADIYGGKLRRLSFEFAIIRAVRVPSTSPTFAIPAKFDKDGLMVSPPVPATKGQSAWGYYDGMNNSVEDQMERLQLISDMGIPVGFENMSPQIQAYAWTLDDMKWTLTRDNSIGNTVAATCTMSFIEYRAARQRFILMPRFAYGVPASKTKAGAKNVTGAELNAAKAYLKRVFDKKVQNSISLGKITYPFTRDALQKLLNDAAKDANKSSFVIPTEWITELNNKIKPR